MDTPNKKKKVLSAAVLAISFAAAIIAILVVYQNRSLVQDLIASLGLMGPLMTIGLYAGLAFSPIPADPLTLISGAVYGPVGGMITAWLGMITASIVEYYVGKKIGKVTDFKRTRSELPYGLGDLPVDSVPFLLGGRLLTGAGSKIVSYLSGIFRISFWRYLWTSAVSTLLGSILFSLIGTGIGAII